MNFVYRIIKMICNIIYFFMKFKRVNKNKIVFISRLSNNKTLDFKLIEEELKVNKNLKIVFIYRKIDSFGKGFLKNIMFTLKSLYHLANAKVCVTDSYSIAVSSVKHKKELKIIQIWHSMGAIKKFGYQTIETVSGRDKNVAKILNMHANYDYIISGSKEMTKYFAKAFNYPENKFLNYGIPRMDYLLKNEKTIKNKIIKKYKNINNKPIILYAPTFRTTKEDMTHELIKSIDLSKFNLIVKGHANQQLEYDKNSVYECSDFTALDLICICDYIITDYSGIAIEAAILNKKTLYYVFDYDEYKKNNGLNIDLYKEMPGFVFEKATDIADFLKKGKYDMKNLINYKNRYIDVQNGTSCKKICGLIIKCLRGEKK